MYKKALLFYSSLITFVCGEVVRWEGPKGYRKGNWVLELPCTWGLRWREQHPAHWSGVLADQVWTLTQTEEKLHCTVYRGEKGQTGKPTREELKALRQYLQLDVSLAQLYSHWSSVDSHFQEVAQKFQGEYRAWGRCWGSYSLVRFFSFTVCKMGIISTS